MADALGSRAGVSLYDDLGSPYKLNLSTRGFTAGPTVGLPPDANAVVSAHTLNGGIDNEFSLQVKKHFPFGQNLDSKLGAGGPEIELSTINGGIHIARSKAVALESR